MRVGPELGEGTGIHIHIISCIYFVRGYRDTYTYNSCRVLGYIYIRFVLVLLYIHFVVYVCVV